MKKALKIIAAALLAFIILEGFSRFYFNKPISRECPAGTTDYIWDENRFYSQWREGYGSGRTNNEGYCDMKDYEPGTHVDVLVMGASYTQGFEVAQDKTYTHILEQMLPDKYIYNIAISGHYFWDCVGNLEAALEKYEPDTVILETNIVKFSDERITEMLDGTVESLYIPHSAILNALAESCFFRLLHHQLSYYSEAHGGIVAPPELKPLFIIDKETDDSETAGIETAAALSAKIRTEELSEYDKLTPLFDYLKALMDKHGTELIIYYHPKTFLSGHGDVWIYDESVDGFAPLCEEYGFGFANLTERMTQEYYENHLLPYGFSNSSAGDGHFNEFGHLISAEELYPLLKGGD